MNFVWIALVLLVSQGAIAGESFGRCEAGAMELAEGNGAVYLSSCFQVSSFRGLEHANKKIASYCLGQWMDELKEARPGQVVVAFVPVQVFQTRTDCMKSLLAGYRSLDEGGYELNEVIETRFGSTLRYE